MNIRCRNCGEETPDYARYCIKCGAEVDDFSAPRDTMTYIGADDGGSPVHTDFLGAIRLFFKNYANFSGRSTRSEYWYAYLFLVLVNIVLEMIKRTTGFGLPRLIWDLSIFIPLMSIGFRRLHDTGRSGSLSVVAMGVTLVWAFVLGMLAGGAQNSGLLIFALLLSVAVLVLGGYLVILLAQPSLININPYGRDPF